MGRWLWAPLLLASSIGRAEPLRLEVTQDGCDLGAVEGAIDALAGRDAFDPAADRVIRVEGASIDGTPGARVWMSDATGQLRGPRVVTAKTCDELVQAVSVVVAMVLPPPDPPRAAAPPPTLELDDPVVVAPAPVARTELRIFAAGAVTGSGSHEQVLAGMAWRHGWVSLQLAVDHDPASTIDVGPLAAIEMSRSDLQVAACGHDGAFAVCPVLGAGVISGNAIGLLRERSIASQVLFTGVAAMWEHALTQRIALRAHVQADVLLTTTDLQVDHMSVWRSPRIDGAAGLGIVVQFP
jgi:hypothetical protein